MAALWVVWLVCDWFVDGLWKICGWFGWFEGNLAKLWVVWLIRGWFRILQLMI